MSMNAFLVGVAGMINAAGLGVYDTNRIFTAADTDTAVVLGELQEDPPLQIAVNGYTVSDDPRLNDSLVGTQFRMRGTENQSSVYAVNDALFNLFQGLHDVTVGGVPVVLAWRQNSLPAGQDKNLRYEHTASFYWQVAWPTTLRTE